MNIFGKLAVTGLALSLSSFASAAISGSTDFRVTLPEILVLYHWDDAKLDLTDAGSVINDDVTRNGSAAVTGSSFTITGDVTTTGGNATAYPTTLDVTLQNAWAVRSLSSGNVSLDLGIQDNTLTNTTANSSEIIVQSATLKTGSAVSGNGSPTVILASGFAPVLGDIDFQLDLTNANAPGEYNTRGTAGPAAPSNNGTDTFLLTLTGQ